MRLGMHFVGDHHGFSKLRIKFQSHKQIDAKLRSWAFCRLRRRVESGVMSRYWQFILRCCCHGDSRERVRKWRFLRSDHHVSCDGEISRNWHLRFISVLVFRALDVTILALWNMFYEPFWQRTRAAVGFAVWQSVESCAIFASASCFRMLLLVTFLIQVGSSFLTILGCIQFL